MYECPSVYIYTYNNSDTFESIPPNVIRVLYIYIVYTYILCPVRYMQHTLYKMTYNVCIHKVWLYNVCVCTYI